MEVSASQQEPLELRVLTGLQSGAALPLEDSLAVGPEEESDLLLLDDGHAPQRLRVRLLPDGGLLLEALDDGVLLASGAVLQRGESAPLAPGDAFRAGEVWLAVQGAGEPWGPGRRPMSRRLPDRPMSRRWPPMRRKRRRSSRCQRSWLTSVHPGRPPARGPP